MTGLASMAGAARDSRLGGETSAASCTGGSTLSGRPVAGKFTVSSSARPKGREFSSSAPALPSSSSGAGGVMRAMPDIDAVSTVFSLTAVFTPFDTGALGRTTELVVSLDGNCKASTPDVDEQPARQSAASTKLTTPKIRIFDLYARQNRPKAGTTPPETPFLMRNYQQSLNQNLPLARSDDSG
ncbi:hypothetical protein MPL3356_240005 [Mesorhizobium plurifarium]|uniref:Uncharacterized protein n=1 Tax=Mesorhizobium plurifarium TaxID=69974 RepID=A0A090DM79_MESPL|nr:hypothetical protein MPL3356_240005 [Mesorhizobium plurifarium]